MLSLLRNPEQLAALRRDDVRAAPLGSGGGNAALRKPSPIQHTGADCSRGCGDRSGKRIRKGQGVMAVLGAANRDPASIRGCPGPPGCLAKRQSSPGFRLARLHFCFGAPIARLEGQIALATLLHRLKNIELDTDRLVWRQKRCVPRARNRFQCNVRRHKQCPLVTTVDRRSSRGGGKRQASRGVFRRL